MSLKYEPASAGGVQIAAAMIEHDSEDQESTPIARASFAQVAVSNIQVSYTDSSVLLLSSSELCDTKVYEPEIQFFASHSRLEKWLF